MAMPLEQMELDRTGTSGLTGQASAGMGQACFWPEAQDTHRAAWGTNQASRLVFCVVAQPGLAVHVLHCRWHRPGSTTAACRRRLCTCSGLPEVAPPNYGLHQKSGCSHKLNACRGVRVAQGFFAHLRPQGAAAIAKHLGERWRLLVVRTCMPCEACLGGHEPPSTTQYTWSHTITVCHENVAGELELGEGAVVHKQGQPVDTMCERQLGG